MCIRDRNLQGIGQLTRLHREVVSQEGNALNLLIISQMLLAHHFSMESGELTNTLKIRRPIINKNYKAEMCIRDRDW